MLSHLATNARVVFEFCSLLIITLTYHASKHDTDINIHNHIFNSAGFPTGVANMEGQCPPHWGGGCGSSQFDGRGGLSQNMAGAWEELKMPSTNTCEGVHVIVKLSAILQLHFYLQQN